MSSRVWSTTSNGEIEVVSLTAEKLEESLHVLRVGFFPQENVCRATQVAQNLNAMKELENLCVDVAKEGCSIIAIDRITQKVVGVAFNKLQKIKLETATRRLCQEDCKRCRDVEEHEEVRRITVTGEQWQLYDTRQNKTLSRS
ncbi:uncharacterized protein LOC112903892 [Agrilus planipennis]|uniref:Uncharacterized protein LOC112903892 n=1 Tax=Agrilus planipennis TaxID=224129 RepID=A0A7F5QZ20_AGRPL|nr:uncharacterized protein LOC112903892 [Agrilus planipennis]